MSNSATTARDYFNELTLPISLVSNIHHELRWLPLDTNEAIPEFSDISLNDTDEAQAAKFVNPRHGLHYRLRRQFRRYCAALATQSDLHAGLPDFVTESKGRPYLANEPYLHFSFSSCQSGLLAGWSSEALIGVDVEDRNVRIDADDLATRFFNAEESAWLAQQASNKNTAFLSLWCLKEAALKSIGEGIPFGLDKFVFDIQSEAQLVDVPDSMGQASDFDAHLILNLPVTAAAVLKKRA